MPANILKNFILTAARFYQRFISPLLGNHCRFYPSCSRYALLAVEKHGVAKGGGLALWRVLRCNPFSKGGTDLP